LSLWIVLTMLSWPWPRRNVTSRLRIGMSAGRAGGALLMTFPLTTLPSISSQVGPA